MHDPIPLGPALSCALTTAEIDATMTCAEAEKSAATRACGWRDCRCPPAPPQLPAHQGLVAAYFSTLAEANLKAFTIGRRAAVVPRHKLAGHETTQPDGAGAHAAR